MFDQHHGNVGVGDLPQYLSLTLDVAWSQAGGRLVEEEHPRLRCQGTGNLHDPLVDMGEPPSRTLQCCIVAHEGQEPRGELHRLALVSYIATHGQKGP
jgi:hypothetical protein